MRSAPVMVKVTPGEERSAFPWPGAQTANWTLSSRETRVGIYTSGYEPASRVWWSRGR